MIVFPEQNIWGNEIGIYQIRNLENNNVYIGQTKECFKRRFWLHSHLLNNNKHDNTNLQHEFNIQNGEGFVFEPIEIVVNVQDKEAIDLDYDEKYYISLARENNCCYNISDGGKGACGVPMTEANRRFHAEHNRILNTGKKASEETRRKMSSSHKANNIITPEFHRKMIEAKQQKVLEGTCINGKAKLSVQQAFEIKQALVRNVSKKELSARYNISTSNIDAIRQERAWKFVHVDGWDEYIKANQARQSRSAN